jgi:hypothetical protein
LGWSGLGHFFLGQYNRLVPQCEQFNTSFHLSIYCRSSVAFTPAPLAFTDYQSGHQEDALSKLTLAIADSELRGTHPSPPWLPVGPSTPIDVQPLATHQTRPSHSLLVGTLGHCSLHPVALSLHRLPCPRLHRAQQEAAMLEMQIGIFLM